jgi:hypothetical protein
MKQENYVKRRKTALFVLRVGLCVYEHVARAPPARVLQFPHPILQFFLRPRQLSDSKKRIEAGLDSTPGKFVLRRVRLTKVNASLTLMAL